MSFLRSNGMRFEEVVVNINSRLILLFGVDCKDHTINF